MVSIRKTGRWDNLPFNEQAFALLRMERKRLEEVVKKWSPKDIFERLRFLDPDECARILVVVTEGKRNKVTELLETDVQEKVKRLLHFNKSAGAAMSFDYIEVEKNETFGNVIRMVVKHEKKEGKFPIILVVNKGYFLGEIEGHTLMLQKENEPIIAHIRKIPAVKYDEGMDTFVRVLKKSLRSKMVVLDYDNSILGVIFSNDLLKLLHEKSEKRLYDFAGVRHEESVSDTFFEKVKNRHRWLILNLFTAFIAAGVVGLFEDTIAGLTLLVIYMPVVAGMGGNAGTPALAVVVRGIALNEIELSTAKRVIVSEVTAGMINGIIIGVLVAAVATLWNHSPVLGLVIGVSMIVNLTIATFFGTLIPLVLKRLGKDPASSASIFITTATDVCGFFTFLGLATWLL